MEVAVIARVARANVDVKVNKTCKLCGGTGYIKINGRGGFSQFRPCPCISYKYAIKRMHSLGFRHKDLEEVLKPGVKLRRDFSDFAEANYIDSLGQKLEQLRAGREPKKPFITDSIGVGAAFVAALSANYATTRYSTMEAGVEIALGKKELGESKKHLTKLTIIDLYPVAQKGLIDAMLPYLAAEIKRLRGILLYILQTNNLDVRFSEFAKKEMISYTRISIDKRNSSYESSDRKDFSIGGEEMDFFRQERRT